MECDRQLLITNQADFALLYHHDWVHEYESWLAWYLYVRVIPKPYSSNLKSVIFLINKLDLIERLINDGYITLSNCRNGKEYAKPKFEMMIQNISRACSDLNIEDFSENSSVFTVSAKKVDDLNPLIASLLEKQS